MRLLLGSLFHDPGGILALVKWYELRLGDISSEPDRAGGGPNVTRFSARIDPGHYIPHKAVAFQKHRIVNFGNVPFAMPRA